MKVRPIGSSSGGASPHLSSRPRPPARVGVHAALVFRPTDNPDERGWSFGRIARLSGNVFVNLAKIILLLPFIENITQRRPNNAHLAAAPPSPPPPRLPEPGLDGFHLPELTLPEWLAPAQSSLPRKSSILIKSSSATTYPARIGSSIANDVVVGPTRKLRPSLLDKEAKKQQKKKRNPPRRRRRTWAPNQRLVKARHAMIRRLVWLDTEGQLQRFVRAQPWKVGDSLQEQILDLGIARRAPLLTWHVNHNIVPTAGDLVAPRRTKVEEETARKCTELKQALLEIVPVFFSLVHEASRREPSVSVRIYRRVARALATLAMWNAGRWMRLSPERQYTSMNNFLRQMVCIVAECQSILECTSGDDACIIDAAIDA